jgi:carbamoyl-phosphate synthase large subunit
MFQEVDPVLGPEMRSTGEVLSMSSNFGEAFFKAQEATQSKLPLEGTLLISVGDRDKPELIEIAREFKELGFKIIATGGTCNLIRGDGIEAEKVCKINEGRPNVLDVISNGKIDLIINTPVGKKGAEDDSFIRKAAIKNRVPYMTTMAAARATAEGIKAVKNGEVLPVKSLQEFHADIR